MLSSRPLPSGEPVTLGFDPERFELLHWRMQKFVDDGQHAGIGLLLARNGEIADIFAVGFRNRELGLPMSRDTIVRIYSMTKIVVSVAALTLLEEGKLGLRDPVSDYLPEFRDLHVLVGGTVQDPELVPADKPLTLQHLFTHTSGLIYEAPGELIGQFYKPLIEEDSESLEQLVSRVARLPLKWQPGTRFEYGLSTDVLGRVVEVVSGRRLDKYLNARILEPLEMVDTAYAVPGTSMERLAKVYEHGTGGGALRQVESLRGELVEGQRNFPGGGSGLFSTLDDFARFGQMLCNRGELGVRIIGRKTWELMVTNHLTGLSSPFHNLGVGHGFGLGVAVRLDDGLAGTLGTVGSFGWAGMATTWCLIDPVENLVALCFAQHLPPDEHGLFQRFANLSYQALSLSLKKRAQIH